MSIIVLAMRDTLEVVKQLESLAFKLVKKHQALENDIKVIQLEKSKLEEDQNLLYKKLQRLSTENDQLKTANSILGSKDYKRETKLKINRLIKEVDSCIVQLSE